MRPTTSISLTCALALLTVVGTSCGEKPIVTIDSPTYGTFLNGTTVTVSGDVKPKGNGLQSFTINGTPYAVTPPSYSVQVPVDPNLVFNEIVVELTTNNNKKARERVVVVVGDGVNTDFVIDGDHSLESVALRISDAGLGQISPIVESLSSDAIDISGLVLSQNPIAQGSFSGINYTANAVDISTGGFSLLADAVPGGIDTTIGITDFFIEVDLELGFLGSCTLEIQTATADISGTFDLLPDSVDPSYADVNLVSGVTVLLGGFSSQFVAGICNDPLIGDIVNLIIGAGEIQTLMQDGFEQNLADPDGAGPLDSPLADSIETALAGISISGPAGEALDAQMDAPLSSVNEDADGITLLADAAITALMPDPAAPDLPASYTVAETPPAWPATTPVGAAPYGIAIGISSSGMNQLLKAQIENGLLRSDITEFLGTPLTAGLVSLLFFSEFGVYPPAEPIHIEIRPQLAPVFTGAAGPAGELAEMRLGGLSVALVLTNTQETVLAMEVDMTAGVDLNFTPAGLEFALAVPASGDIGIAVTENPLLIDEMDLIVTFQGLFPLFAPELEGAIEAFPVPSLLGLDMSPLEVARLAGGFIALFADLVEIPTTKIENVVFSDLSTGDSVSQGGCWLEEWRHRLSGNGSTTGITAKLKGMLGADAGCTTNDASKAANVHYKINFDVSAVAGEQWSIDVDHSILGAYDRISDGYNDGIGFQDGGGNVQFTTAVQGSYRIDAGPATSFDFNPSPTQLGNDGIGGPSTNEDVEFSGANGETIVGTTSASIELEFFFHVDAYSNSNTAFPTANGDEMAIRFGKNDTIDNNFTAGSYPGMGGRNIADDGHLATVELTVTPIP